MACERQLLLMAAPCRACAGSARGLRRLRWLRNFLLKPQPPLLKRRGISPPVIRSQLLSPGRFVNAASRLSGLARLLHQAAQQGGRVLVDVDALTAATVTTGFA